MGDMYKDLRELSKQERRERTLEAPAKLKAAGLAFELKNGGSHVILMTQTRVVDFWPGNELWIVRGSKKRQYGIDELIAFTVPNQETETECQ